MDQQELLAIQKAGANARSIGRSEIDNPYYRPPEMPAKTGESLKDWEAKAEAWRLGWLLESAMRD